MAKSHYIAWICRHYGLLNFLHEQEDGPDRRDRHPARIRQVLSRFTDHRQSVEMRCFCERGAMACDCGMQGVH